MDVLRIMFKFWWFFALFSLGYGFYIHGELTRLEATGGEIELNMILIGIYHLTGKWGVAGLFAFGGFVVFPGFGGVYHLFLKRRLKEDPT